MVGRPVADRAERRAIVAAERKAEEKHEESAFGMKAKAAELRRRAVSMADSNDRNAMLRVANGLERQADEVHRYHSRLS